MAQPIFISIFIFFFVLFFYFLNQVYRSRKHALPLPPGPKGLPLVGNIKDLPRSADVPVWEHWLAHKDAYGPISSITVFGTTFVILNSSDVVLELLTKRAAIYSGRISQELSSKTVGWSNTLGMMQPGPEFKLHRKHIASIANQGATLKVFDRVQEEEAAHFLGNLLESPDQLLHHVRKEAAATVARIVYGYVPNQHGNDPLIDLVNEVMEDLADASTTGRYLVDVIPLLKYLPEWFPGAGFKTKGRLYNRRLMVLAELPLALAKKQIREKTHRVSYLSQAMEASGSDPDTDNRKSIRCVVS